MSKEQASARAANHGVHRLAIVIVNYRTPALVVHCLRSLSNQIDSRRDRAVVVDSASDDDSVRVIREALAEHGWSSWASILELEHNRGLSAGINAGVRSVAAEAYLLLNSDTRARPGAIAELMEAMTLHSGVGLFGPRLEFPDGVAQESVFSFHRPLSELVRSAATGPVSRLLDRFVVARPATDEPVSFEWASLAAMLVRGEVFESTGMLDERYFLFFEDADFCRRARSAGVRTLYWPRARIVHLRGGSTPVKRLLALRERPPRYFYASRSLYFAKHHGRRGLFAANLCWYTGRMLSKLREVLGKKTPHLCKHEATDIWVNFWHPIGDGSRRG